MREMRRGQRALANIGADSDPSSARSAVDDSPCEAVDPWTTGARAIGTEKVQPLSEAVLTDIASRHPRTGDGLGRGGGVVAEHNTVPFEVRLETAAVAAEFPMCRIGGRFLIRHYSSQAPHRGDGCKPVVHRPPRSLLEVAIVESARTLARLGDRFGAMPQQHRRTAPVKVVHRLATDDWAQGSIDHPYASMNVEEVAHRRCVDNTDLHRLDLRRCDRRSFPPVRDFHSQSLSFPN